MILDTYTDRIELFSLLQRILIQGQTWLWPLVFMVNMRALLLMVFSGTLYGILWTMRISGSIAEERTNGRYDLLCLSLNGEIGAVWAICTGCLHQHRAFQQVNSQEAWSVRLILFIPIVISAPLIFRQLFSVTVTTTLTGIFAIIIIFYLDHVQSILFGSLIGVLVSHYAPNPQNQRMWAAIGFLVVQVVSYLFLGVVNFLLLPLLYRYMSNWYGDLTVAVINILAFFVVVEFMLNRLWSVLVKQVSGTAAELHSLMTQERKTGGYADPQVMARTP
jgi:hypothetical protein